MDALLLGYQQAFPAAPFAVGFLLDADGTVPCVQDLRALVADRARDHPPLTHRLASGRWGRPYWVVDADFSVDRHVHERRLPAGSGLAGLRRAVERLSAAEIPLNAPPWQLWLLHGHRPGGITLLLRASHVWMDGTALNLLLGRMFGLPGRQPEPMPARRVVPERRPGPRAVGRAAAHTLGWCTRTTTIGSLTATPTGRPRHTWLDVDLGWLRAISRAYEVTVNDIFLAALTGALRAWSPAGTPGRGRRGEHRGQLYAAMPVSTRTAAERELGGNRLTTVRLALPHGEPSARRRVEAIRRQTDRHKRRGTPGVAERLFLWATPAPLRPAVMSAEIMSRVFALTASNPRGLVGPMAVLGRPVTAAVPLPALPGNQRMAVMLGGLDGRACIGFTMDGSVRDCERVPELVDAELRVLATEAGLGHGPTPTEIGTGTTLSAPRRPLATTGG
ncbi:conserved hypothetical protein [Frankia canadensis]|uniref:diacylglycerol O-acyltransferase n=1 Tax=Frankia canadensis TaxID=1836972 RepID=A0A2I2KNL8_9ACTN|nr:wax ester/triacylglycerol synthase domain-containing protein [Frankia canadensis]SNQ47258.1 conserved hypothetical protein [Frankia canadensis]SOU54548.1 conserved hypothetical protein [Frankia canadensis]